MKRPLMNVWEAVGYALIVGVIFGLAVILLLAMVPRG